MTDQTDPGVSRQPAATRRVPRSTPASSAPRRPRRLARKRLHPRHWAKFFDERFYSDEDWDVPGLALAEDYRDLDPRFCEEALSAEYGIDDMALHRSLEKFRLKVEGTAFPGVEAALEDTRRWLRRELVKRYNGQ